MYFIAYHKAHEYGPYWLHEDGTCAFYSAKKTLMERSIGATVMVIQGWRPGSPAPARYALACMFTPEGEVTEAEEGRYRIEGPATRLYPVPDVLNGLDWFERLFRQQRNFSLGFNTLNDPEIISELLRLPHQNPGMLSW